MQSDPAVWSIRSGQEPTGGSRSFTAYVTRLGCNGGVTGKVLPPRIDKGTSVVVVTFTVKAAEPGPHSCQGNRAVPTVVNLGEAIGNRQLVDGACRAGKDAATTAFCDSGAVRWKA